MSEKKYRTDLMRPIVPVDQFNKLREAGLIWFDFTMSEGNKYGFHPDKIVEMYEENKTLKEKAQLLDIVNHRLNELAMKQTKALLLLEESCGKCILTYHGEDCTKRICEFKSMREALEAEA